MDRAKKGFKLSKFDTSIWRYEDHWGELPSKTQNNISPEDCQAIIMSAVRHEKPKEYHPELMASIVTAQKVGERGWKPPIVHYPVNEMVRHTIRLNAYCKKLQQLIRLLATEKSQFRAPPMEELHKIPEMIARKPEPNIYRFPELDSDVINKMIEKSVIVVLAHTGYEKVKKSALNTLVDVTKEYMMKICLMYHSFAEKDLNSEVSQQEILEKALRTVGCGGVESVKDYYKKKVLLKREQANTRARRLLAFYDKLLAKHGLSNAVKTD